MLTFRYRIASPDFIILSISSNAFLILAGVNSSGANQLGLALADGGSVQGIDALDSITMGHDIPVKEVFKTFKEINQLELVNQAGLRQQYIDQSVSLNLAFPSEATPKWLNKVHFDAWKKGVKTLYYTRTESVLRGDIAQQAMSEDCLACDG